MREIIRVLAVGFALSAAPAFAQVPPAPAPDPCVSVELAVQRLEAAGIKVLGASHAPFTNNELLYLKLGDAVVAVAIIEGCVVGDPLPIGAFKAEFGI